MNRVLAALLTFAMLAVGCDIDDSPSLTEPLAHSTSPTLSPITTKAAPVHRMIVPDVVGEELGSARDMVRERGLGVRVFKSVGSACLPRGVVVSQQTRTRPED